MSSDTPDRQPSPDAHPDPALPSGAPAETPEERQRRRFLIGSQRDSYRPNPKRDQIPVVDPEAPPAAEPVVPPPVLQTPPPVLQTPPPVVPETPAMPEVVFKPTPAPTASPLPEVTVDTPVDMDQIEQETLRPVSRQKVTPPSPRRGLSAELEREYEAMLGDVGLDALMAGGRDVSAQEALEPDTKLTARVISVRRDDVFVELSGREQGILPLHQFPQPPEPGAMLEVRIVRLNREDGLYELALPGVASNVADWSEIDEGMVIEVRITAHNTGGLECEVNRIRGFIPISQIALYRVENLEEFVGQKLACVVTEANPERRNLVLSHRAVLEREREESRKAVLEGLAPGQIREGIVRKLMDFGAFVDLGGVDGLLHVSQLAWGRVKHPSEVVQEGQRIKVRVDKIDRENNRISLSYRDLMESPWTAAAGKFLPHTPVHGRVTRLMDFGAFVELEPGVEGLVHISELSNKRVVRVSDVVKEGDEVEVMVLSVDPSARRISLSMKSLMSEPQAAATPEPEPEPAQKVQPRRSNQPLKGGLGRAGGGEQFGLNW